MQDTGFLVIPQKTSIYKFLRLLVAPNLHVSPAMSLWHMEDFFGITIKIRVLSIMWIRWVVEAIVSMGFWIDKCPSASFPSTTNRTFSENIERRTWRFFCNWQKIPCTHLNIVDSSISFVVHTIGAEIRLYFLGGL